MKKILMIAIAAMFALACTSSQNVTLTGAGATFPLPFYTQAFKTYETIKPIAITYGGIGSGGGIRSLKDKVVHFAGSDAYLSDKEMGEMPSNVLHIPTCMGAVVVAYNLDGIKELNLNSDIISKIYLGEIKNWNDAQISKINPNVVLPDLAITPAYRSDGSGTTFVFSDYMSKVSQAWKETMGTGKALKWNVGVAAKGNPGVAGIIKQTKGAIGYVGSEYAFALNMPTAAIENPNGEFVKASTESISASLSGEIASDTRQMITASHAKGSYPISCLTWILIYKNQEIVCQDKLTAQKNVEMLNWLVSSEAQSLTEKVHYAPLPKSAVNIAKNILKTVTYNGETLNER